VRLVDAHRVITAATSMTGKAGQHEREPGLRQGVRVPERARVDRQAHDGGEGQAAVHPPQCITRPPGPPAGRMMPACVRGLR
jgi:hypothetical protein